MRIVIAGGTGVLGQRIVPSLLGLGHQVTILARRPERARPLAALGAEVAAGDVFDAERVRQVVTAAAPEVVMHQLTDLAGGVGPGNAEVRRADVSSFVHADDAAAAAVAALDWPPGAVNIVDDEPAAARVWVPVFCAAVGAPVPATPPVRDAASAQDTASERTRYARGASNRYARRELGWKPAWPSWRDGFTELAHEQLHDR